VSDTIWLMGDTEDAGAGLAQVTPPSFAEFYQQHFDSTVRLARMLTGTWDTATDVTQDAFCGLHRNWRRVDQPEPYLRRSVVNGAAGYHRRILRDRNRPQPVPGVSQLDAHELSDALASLPPRQRAALVLRFHLDLPDADIAAILRCRVGTVASLVHRGLATLRTQLTD